jgi:hypothetical protein
MQMLKLKKLQSEQMLHSDTMAEKKLPLRIVLENSGFSCLQ